MIPKITHQIYFQGFDALPEADRSRILAFRDRNPTWSHRFYDESTAERWIAQNCDGEVLDAYRRIDPLYYAARADLLRYLVCRHHGGVYLDIKSEAARPLDEVLRADDSYILSQWPELRDRPAGMGNHADLAHVPGDEFVIWFIVSSPDHPFLKAVIDRVLRNIDEYDPWRVGVGRLGVLRTTGPIAYTKAIYPVLSQFPHRVVRAELDLGFNPSRFGDHKAHRTQYGRHYETVSDPVVRTGAVTRYAVRLWFRDILPEIERTRHRARKLCRMIMRGRAEC